MICMETFKQQQTGFASGAPEAAKLSISNWCGAFTCWADMNLEEEDGHLLRLAPCNIS